MCRACWTHTPVQTSSCPTESSPEFPLPSPVPDAGNTAVNDRDKVLLRADNTFHAHESVSTLSTHSAGAGIHSC